MSLSKHLPIYRGHVTWVAGLFLVSLSTFSLAGCGGGGGGGGESSETSANMSAETSASMSADTNATDTNATDTNATDTNATDTNSTDTNSTETNSSDTNSTDTDTSNDDGSGGCEVGFACAPPPPIGWEGPVILAENPGGGAPGCSGDYATVVGADVSVGLNAPDAECGCLCGDPEDVVCKGDFNRTAPGDSACISAQLPFPITGEICSPVSFDPDEHAWLGDAHLFGGWCSAAITENIPEVSWDAGANICAPAQEEWAECDDEGECVPYNTRICVYKSGDSACPMGFIYKFSAYEDYFDTRGCTSCTCEVDEDCSGTISMYASQGGLCNTVPVTMDALECFDTPPGGIQSAFWEIPEMDCVESTPSNPTGSVTPTLPTTVCCMTED